MLNSTHRYVYLAWAMWERRLGNPDTAVALLKRGQSLNPTDPAIYQAWAIVERERGSIERARGLFEMGLKADPSHIPLWQAWGVMEADYVSCYLAFVFVSSVSHSTGYSFTMSLMTRRGLG